MINNPGGTQNPPNGNGGNFKLKRSIFLSWNEISETKLIEDWMFEVLFKSIFGQNYILNSQNYVFGNPVIYFGVRRVKRQKNKDVDTNVIFPDFM